MHVVHYEDAGAFCDRVLPYLLRREAENNLMISIITRLADGTGKWGDEPPVLCAIDDQWQVVAAAVQTPPYHLQLTRMEGATVTCLVDSLRASGHDLPGMLGPETAVNAFAECWTAATGVRVEREHGLGIYQLARVIPPIQPGGGAEFATPTDTAILCEWVAAFNALTGASRQGAEETVREGLEQQRFWLWKNPHPVSMAAYTGPTLHGMRIGSVYTPPEYRGKGYASANVAALSQYLLNSGRRFCYLFTDLTNPISNSIYRKIGYRSVCDFASYRFIGG